MKHQKDKIVKYLKIQSRTENLSKVRKFVSDAAKKFGFDEDEINHIALAVDEACTNIIRHAYENQGDKIIEIHLLTSNNSFEVRIIDYGKPFEPEKIRKPDLKHHLEKYNKGGLGMFLMRSLMDKVEYQINKNNHNEVRLIKKINK